LREVNSDEDLLGFGIDIANVNTAFMSEEDPIALKIVCD
jgi:hypothetical protein